MPTFTETTEIDEVRVEPLTGNVLWRQVTVVERDGVEISRTFLRESVSLEDPRADLPAIVLAARPLADTPKARDAIRKKKDDLAKGPGGKLPK